jgi:hypothetical protein
MEHAIALAAQLITLNMPPNSQYPPMEEPGRRTGEGLKSILPHLQRQVQTQIKQPVKRTTPDQPDAPDSESPREKG